MVEVGDGVAREFKRGDRVAGCSRAAESIRDDVGVFNEYAVVKADIALHIPDSMSFTDAATLGVAVITTGRCLFDTFSIPYPEISAAGELSAPSAQPQQIFIYGGSSVMGTMTIQWAKLAGLHVLTTSSPANGALVESFGPDFIVDHYSTEAPEQIVAEAAKLESKFGPLRNCVDNISQPQSAIFCCKALNPSATPPSPDAPTEWVPTWVDSDLHYSTLGPFTPPLPGIRTSRTLGFSFLGEEWEQMGTTHPPDMEDFERAKRFAVVAERCLKAGLVKPHPVEVMEGGLEGIPAGIERLRKGDVSGTKLVYVVDAESK